MPDLREISVDRPVSEKIEEMKAKKCLLDGDRKAYNEISQLTIKRNKEKIKTLRKENKELRQKLHDLHMKDEAVINKALKDKPTERASLKNKTGQEAITILDHKVSDGMRLLNALKHQVAVKEKQLRNMQITYNEQQQASFLAITTDKKESTEAQDSLKWPLVLENLEKEIKQSLNEQEELQSMYRDAQLSKENALKVLKKHEDMISHERKKREIQLQELKKEAEEKRMLHDRIERRFNAQRPSFQQQDETASGEKQVLSGEEQQQKISTYEEAFRRIKEATGVSDTMEVVSRFENQGATTAHLEELKQENEKQISLLREEKVKLQKTFEEMKYTGETKLSRGQRMLEEFQEKLQEEETSRAEIENKLEKMSKILLQVKSGIDHLADRLSHLKTPKGYTASTKLSPSSNEYVLDQLALCEEKLLKLMDDFHDVDLEKVQKQMEDEEFHINIESRLPAYNTRVKLSTQLENIYAESESSREDEPEVLSRSAIKKISQSIIDAKMKKDMPRRRKKTK
ncbi:coiled-coil domain-containing protein 151-like isoform X2 [Octopus sinensis]|uniref:Coiled-coil domain-containing protein 151-like isoform X2 n=1 Tax=Octopus sinensis TaxID=2607531 RepID=A0A7E6EPK7_9MOLL|nr:coiled-coil domain-containing protein 151-like isoform X2 [Octopus sinensis]